MQIAKGVMVAGWIVVALNLAIAYGVIAVLNRMSPAIEHILEQNDFSLEACQEMLAVLAHTGTPRTEGAGEASGPAPSGTEPTTAASDALAQRFDLAYRRAMGNITEHEEVAALEKIAEHHSAALAGNRAARDRTIEAIIELAAVNREAMKTADLSAQRLRRAGEWCVAIMAGVSFLVQLAALRLLQQRVLATLEEIKAVVDAQRQGESMRRFAHARTTPEIRLLYDGLNSLLDQRAVDPAPLIDGPGRPPDSKQAEPSPS